MSSYEHKKRAQIINKLPAGVFTVSVCIFLFICFFINRNYIILKLNNIGLFNNYEINKNILNFTMPVIDITNDGSKTGFIDARKIIESQIKVLGVYDRVNEYIEKNILEEGENYIDETNESTDESKKEEPEFASSINWEEYENIRMDDPVKKQELHEIKFYNEAGVVFDAKKLLSEPIKIPSMESGPQILIYHTHTSEAYRESDSFDRDNNMNVVRIGQELADNLIKKYAIDVIHDTIINDEDYNKSYTNSYNTIIADMVANPSLNFIFDIHRDASGTENSKINDCVEIDGKRYAQIMFVTGSNVKYNHPEWQENLKLAIKLQYILEDIAPGITKPIYISVNRYNQHVSPNALIIEMGGNGNSVDEAVNSAEILSYAIDRVISSWN